MWRFRPDVDFIHARADYAATISVVTGKLLNIPIIWDCRGDTEAEFATAYNPSSVGGRLFKRLSLWLIRWRASFAAGSCARAIFVSEELRKRKWRYLSLKPSEIIPTSVSRDTFFFSPELRQSMRNQLGLTPEQRVLLYSGGIVGYQNFAEYVRMFSNLLKCDNSLRLLVITPQIERAQRMLQDLSPASWILRSAPFGDMNAYYNAADFGVLLREHNAVNDVASPTKFGEYCMTGLPVIMNDSVKQSFRFAQMFGNLIYYSDDTSITDLVPKSADERVQISEMSAKMLSRECLAERYERIYDFG
jgi:glycosyltransferase involved in cell wall biosynthesis